ncbi:MAG: flagellar biosynthetic protein FliO [Proteobacteria bacterium]|nr:flagellar biosynthetic protein FliO [Pseudomonadota bacterium]
MALFPDLPPLPAALLALGVVLALVWLAGRLAPRLLGARLRGAGIATLRPGQAGGGRLARLETLPLGPRHRLHLIRCDGRDMVLLTGGPQDVVVGWLPDAAPPAGPTQAG